MRALNWAVVDQLLVSACNFAIGVLLARSLGPDVFGVFVVLHLLMLYANSFQGALILQPFLSVTPQLADDRRAEYIETLFALQLMLSLTLGLLALGLLWLGTSFGASWSWNPGSISAVSWTAALVAFQIQDWVRRYYFVVHRPRAALANDLISYVMQVTIIATAAGFELLDVPIAFLAVAFGSMLAAGVGILTERIRPGTDHIASVVREGWRRGRDVLVAWQLQWVSAQGIVVFCTSVMGTSAAGGVRATTNLVGVVNVLFQAMDNVVPVTAARNYAARGLEGLLSYVWFMTKAGTVVLLPVLVALALAAEPIMRTVYGEPFETFAGLVYWAVALTFVQFHLRTAFFFFRTIMATEAIMRCAAATASTSIILAALTVHRFGPDGVMFALLGGAVVGLAYSLRAAHVITARLRLDAKT